MTTNTPTLEISDSLVRKIQLLLNLAARPEGNEAEAAAAMGKAQELLAQYNLDLGTVQDKVVAGGVAAREAETKRDYARVSKSAMYQWQRNLVRTVAEANFCRYWVEDTTETRWNRLCQVKRHKVLGRVVNTTAVLVMVDYLLETIERLLPWTGRERLCREAVLWREGCADRLVERINAKAAAMRKADYATQGEAAYSTAIQVADLAKKEEAGNYDHYHGAGQWALKLKSEAESAVYWSEEAVAAREAERLAKLAAARALESPAQKAKREREEAAQARRDERASARYSERYWREQDKQGERKASAAYRAGQAKGNDIGLDGQLGASTQKGLGR